MASIASRKGAASRNRLRIGLFNHAQHFSMRLRSGEYGGIAVASQFRT
ncbi:hypothetical protein AVDCRST_MAG94-6368 [uncultured Leptolyngbya sp.]|uniref:Uncharacterized protein n=1 Tax=uncultured Leptolyngbya sp. TaxID=332963 RepID=A0A6J4PH30_9CYAN|nr:hypothetical protein AVDCRST_MAG94-6368 [uncultured Leptolyngbya sp.]